MQYPCTTIWKCSDQILNTVKYPQHHQGIAHRTHFYSKCSEIPSATLGNCWQPYGNASDTAGYRWILLATLNTQIIFFLNVFSDGHEAATKDGDHLFESIHSVYSNKSHQTTCIPATLLATQIPSNTQVFELYLDCQHQIPNTVKYYMGTSL